MKTVFSSLVVVGLAGSVASAAFAAESAADAVRRCGAITDNFARLACFDNLARTAPAAAAPTASSAGAAPAAAAATAGAAGTAVALGDESLKKSNAERAAAASGPSNLTAHVTALREMSQKRYRLTLDNGQVWQQEETQPLTMPEVGVGETVYIEKGSLGGYRMATVRNGKNTNWIRVTRQK